MFILDVIGPPHYRDVFKNNCMLYFILLTWEVVFGENHTTAVSWKIFDVLDFYREPVYLCTCVNVYKNVRIISYRSPCLSFTVCKRMLIFLGKVLWEQSGKVDSHKQANLRHLLREALESGSTLLQICTTHHKLCFPLFYYYYYSLASGRICCFPGTLL